MTNHKIIIAGIGNILLRDDGVGVHAVRELAKANLEGIGILDIGTAILHGVGLIESADRVLVIDAAAGGCEPGTIYFFDADLTVPERVSSIHALGLVQAARMLLDKPPRIAVIGIEPAVVDYGTELSIQLQTALPHVLALARETVSAWGEQAVSKPELVCVA